STALYICHVVVLWYSCLTAAYSVIVLFFFQAEDGIRARNVTGVQTCALPISSAARPLYVVETRFLVPSTSAMVMATLSPSAHSWRPSANRPRRILGPCRSARTPTARPDSSAAERTHR